MLSLHFNRVVIPVDNFPLPNVENPDPVPGYLIAKSEK